MRRFFVAGLALALSGCFYMFFVHQPGSVKKGEVFTATLDVIRDPGWGMYNTTPYGCVSVPASWDVIGASWLLNDQGHETSGNADTSSDRADGLESTVPLSGKRWHCYAGPGQEYGSEARGSFLFSILPTTDGEHLLTYVVGTAYDGMYTSTDRRLTAKIVVDGTASFIDRFGTADEERPGRLTTVVHSGKQFMAFDEDRWQVVTSPDGRTWQPDGRTYPGGASLRHYAESDDIVLAADSSRIYIGEPSSWRQVYQPVNGVNRLAFFDSAFLAVNYSGYLLTSTNGEDWSNGPYIGHVMYDLAVSDGVVVTVGAGGKIFSWNGATLTERTSPVTAHYLEIARGDELFAAITATDFVTSTTGVDWFETTAPSNSLYDVAWVRDRFVVTTGDGLFSSTDGGETWEQHWPGSRPTSNLRSLASDGEILVVREDYFLKPGVFYSRPAGFEKAAYEYAFPKTVPVGSSAHKELAIRNVGTEAMYAHNITGGATSAFSMRSFGCLGVLAADAGCMLSIGFAPTEPGEFSETLYLNVTQPTAFSLPIRLSGSAAAPRANEAPSVPSLVSPANGATGLNYAVELAWKESIDPDGDPISYEVWLCTDEDFVGCIPTITSAATAALPAAAGVQYAAVFGLMGLALVFARRRPAMLAMLLVAGTMHLSACAGDDIKSTDATAAHLSQVVAELESGTTYYWKVIATDGITTAESEVRRFTTK